MNEGKAWMGMARKLDSELEGRQSRTVARASW